MACVIAVGGWMVREYMNIFEVAAMVGRQLSGEAVQMRGTSHASEY
jgi:hypothetical protein